MSVLLGYYRKKLLVRIAALDRAFDRHTQDRPSKKRLDRIATQEGLLSGLWQAWCWFSREVVISSALGAVTTAGHSTHSPYAGHSEMEIAFVATQFSRRRSFTSVRALAGQYLEPTWGDIQKINLIINGLQPTNLNSLQTGFGSVVLLRDLQFARNCCAHLNRENLFALKTARARFNQTKYIHPSDMMFWIVPTTSDFVWKEWVDEIDAASEVIVR